MNHSDPPEFDVIVVGSGPAGVSAAFPLIDAGFRVLMVDGGVLPDVALPRGEYLESRASDARQWEWMVGRDFQALRQQGAMSPKFRAPTLDYVFRDFLDANRIAAEDFVPVGSLAVGGLSNAWGCGVAAFSARDLEAFPFPGAELMPCYEAVARRIGISGRADDDLAGFYGIDAWAEPPVAMDALHENLQHGYRRRREALNARGFRLGRARVAVISSDQADGRRACTRSGFCLWGCAEESLYTARFDVRALVARDNFLHLRGFVVDRLERIGEMWNVCGQRLPGGGGEIRRARSVVLAAGTLATTRIAMRSLPDLRQAPLLGSPSAAFALWLPKFTGAARAAGPGFAQLGFALDGDDPGAVSGFVFSTHALPVAEFVRYAPLARRNAIGLFSALLSSVVVANCFFPGALSKNSLQLEPGGRLRVIGGSHARLEEVSEVTRKRLRACFLRANALMLPGSFRLGQTGADAHYAGSLPMRRNPANGETHADGELAGLPGVFVADAAAFPSLPSKPPTFVMMACADRLGKLLVTRLRQIGAGLARAVR
jgi:choline dehydrogenase-like flavoprotein